MQATDARRDPFSGLIVPLENPVGANRLTGSKLVSLAAKHFNFPEGEIEATIHGVGLARDDTLLDLKLNGQIVTIKRVQEKSSTLTSQSLPNQP